jgi:hypothetical protein
LKPGPLELTYSFKAMIKLQEGSAKRPVREQLNTCIDRYNDYVQKGLKLIAVEKKMIYALLQLPDEFLAVLNNHYQRYRHDQGGRAWVQNTSLSMHLPKIDVSLAAPELQPTPAFAMEILGSDFIFPGFVPECSTAEWREILTVTTESLVLWAERVRSAYEAKVSPKAATRLKA